MLVYHYRDHLGHSRTLLIDLAALGKTPAPDWYLALANHQADLHEN